MIAPKYLGWAATASCGVAVVLGAGLFGAQPQASIQGDQLGPDVGESVEAYIARANESLDALDAAQESAFAMVSFDRPLSAADAADAMAGIDRVGALVPDSSAPVALPEPTGGERRADVFVRELGRLAVARNEIPSANSEVITALIVWDDADSLRALPGTAHVRVVEVAPQGASWGGFAVRPLSAAG